jgi:hypothetical protein
MNTAIESLAYWPIHLAAADAAKAKGACWLCCTKVGCNATDPPGEKPRELHPECARALGAGKDGDEPTAD